MSADLENYDGSYFYTVNLNEGLGIEKNQEEAKKYFEYADSHARTDANFRYGFALANGIGVEKDQRLACIHYRQAAVQGDTNAMFFYGFMLLYHLEQQPDKDIKEGWRYIKMAAILDKKS